jgi:hypothetical protein
MEALRLGSYTTFNTFMLLRSGSDPVSLLFAKFLQKIIRKLVPQRGRRHDLDWSYMITRNLQLI